MDSGLKAVIFGATGAVGRTLVPTLLSSSKWSQVLCVVRNQPQEWSKLENRSKLKVQVQKDMDKILQVDQWKLQGYDSMFVCFGSQVKHGEETFVKVDKTYPLKCADIAINNKIPHYLIVSSGGSSADSMFLYMRVKGQLEKDLKLKKVNYLSILKPGLIKNRPDARFGEKVAQVFSFLPFPSIQCRDLALSLRGIAETRANQARNSSQKIQVLDNSELLKFLQTYKS